MVADTEELEKMDASENPCRKTRFKGSVNVYGVLKNVYSQSQMER